MSRAASSDELRARADAARAVLGSRLERWTDADEPDDAEFRQLLVDTAALLDAEDEVLRTREAAAARRAGTAVLVVAGLSAAAALGALLLGPLDGGRVFAALVVLALAAVLVVRFRARAGSRPSGWWFAAAALVAVTLLLLGGTGIGPWWVLLLAGPAAVAVATACLRPEWIGIR